MSSYIEQQLSDQEGIVYSTKISHWSMFNIYALAVLLLIIGLVIYPVLIFAVLFFFKAYIKRASTELAITNRRVVAKFGFIRRDVTEMPLHRVESVRVHQSIWGRLFNFGTLHISGAGNPLVVIPSVFDPLAFRQQLDSAKGLRRDKTPSPEHQLAST